MGVSIISGGKVVDLSSGSIGGPGLARVDLWATRATYAAIWRAQPEVRTTIGGLARNLAQLGIHLFRRVSDDDRERITDHPAARTLSRPHPNMTGYQLILRWVSDFCIYGESHLRIVQAGDAVALQPIPAGRIRPKKASWVEIDEWEIDTGATTGTRWQTIPADDIITLVEYNPDSLTAGVSRLETLRLLLAESHEAMTYRGQLWQNGARQSAYLRRPAEAPKWAPETRNKWLKHWRETWGPDGAGSGGTPLLEEGMELVNAGFSPVEAQYIESRRLIREEVAAAFDMQASAVGILDKAAAGSVKERHRALYTETLGPWTQLIRQTLNQGLIERLWAGDDLYCELNIEEKLRGSFEEQARSASTSVGAPWLTVNEQRARANLPAIEGGNDLIRPLNVIVGGQPSPQTPTEVPEPKATGPVRTKAGPVTGRTTATVDVFLAWLDRLEQSTKSRQGASLKAAIDEDRWTGELVTDLLAADLVTATAAAATLTDTPNVAAMQAWFAVRAEGVATNAAELVAEWAELGDWEIARTEIEEIAVGHTTGTWNFAAHDTAVATGHTHKGWNTNSGNPRPEHSALNGQTVPISATFSNGARWPGDGRLPPGSRANCECTMTFSKEDDA